MSTTAKRADLRHAAVATLSNMGRAPYPTMAEGRIFDSKSDAIQHHQDQSQVPFALVYTDESVGYLEAAGMGAQFPWPTLQTLIIEIGLTSNLKDAQTDAALEDKLDRFQQQVEETLFDQSQNKHAKRFKKIYAKVLEAKSWRMASSKPNERLAMRCLEYVVLITPDCKDYASVFGPLDTIGLTVDHDGEQIQAPMTDLQA